MTTQNDNAAQPAQQQPPVDENTIIAERRSKLNAIREQGVAFPNDFRPEHKAAELHAQYGELDNEALEANPVKVSIAGRMMLKRVMGKASFATLQDSSGPRADGRMQLYVTNDVTGPEAHGAFKHYDLGDILGAEGTLFKTKTGELSVKVTGLRLITKSLRPLPDKFHGLSDQETKYRQRYVDLIMNEDTRRDAVVDPPFHGKKRVHGSRSADAACDPRRRGSQAFHHPSQCARHADVPAHCAGAVSETAGGRRF